MQKTPPSQKDWIWKPTPSQHAVEALQQDLKIGPALCSLLIQRGIETFDEAKTFFRPSLDMLHDPFEMLGMGQAVERLNQAIFDGQKILLYGDYDVDGTTSVGLLYNFLKEFSANVYTYIPDRYTEGYGVSKLGIQWAADHKIDLMICLDCGIRAIETLAVAADNQIDVIVCDHHLPGDRLPVTLAILDPKQANCTYPYKELSGCGIGFKLLQAFCEQNSIEDQKLFKYLDLVAISIACDIVPITDENRVLTYFGLRKLNQAPTPGIAALVSEAGLNTPLTISDVVFGLGPRINAAGRINHAKTALDLLVQETKEEAMIFAEKLNIENQERRSFDESITEEALQQIENEQRHNSSSILFNKNWHKGVIGIVASRCIENYYRPTIVMTESNGKISGSARSIKGFDIHDAIEKCAEHLEQFGGHRHAAGLTMSKENLTAFSVAFEKVAQEGMANISQRPSITIDLELNFETIDYSFMKILKQIGPFGPENMQPVFQSKNVKLKTAPRVLKDKHLKLFVEQEPNGPAFDAIGFGLGHFSESLDDSFDIAYTIEENTFRGETTLQLVLKDIKA